MCSSRLKGGEGVRHRGRRLIGRLSGGAGCGCDERVSAVGRCVYFRGGAVVVVCAVLLCVGRSCFAPVIHPAGGDGGVRREGRLACSG